MDQTHFLVIIGIYKSKNTKYYFMDQRILPIESLRPVIQCFVKKGNQI